MGLNFSDILQLRDQARQWDEQKPLREAQLRNQNAEAAAQEERLNALRLATKKAEIESKISEKMFAWRQQNPWADGIDDTRAQSLALFQTLNPDKASPLEPENYVLQDPGLVHKAPPVLPEHITNQIFGISPKEDMQSQVFGELLRRFKQPQDGEPIGGGSIGNAPQSVGGMAADAQMNGLLGMLNTPEGRALMEFAGMDPNKLEPPTYPVTNAAGPNGPQAIRIDRAGRQVGTGVPLYVEPKIGTRQEPSGVETNFPYDPRNPPTWTSKDPNAQQIGAPGVQFYVDAAGGNIPGLTPNSTQAEAEMLYNAFMAGKGGSRGSPGLPTKPSSGLKGGPSMGAPGPGFQTTAQKAAIEKVAQNTAENATAKLSASEMGNYATAEGKPIQGLLTRDELSDGLKSGLYRKLEEQKGGETLGKLGIVVAPSLDALAIMEGMLFDKKGAYQGKDLLKSAELVPDDLNSWRAKGMRITGLAKQGMDYSIAKQTALEPIGRLLSGGVISRDEASRFMAIYAPVAGDSESQVKAKLLSLKQVYGQLARAADANQVGQMVRDAIAQKPDNATPSAPQRGSIVDGYTFTGGDPADKKNWKPVPKMGKK